MSTGRDTNPIVGSHYTGIGTCPATGKQIHPTRAAARTIRNRLRNNRGGGRPAIYPCPHCTGYHIGHKPRAVRNGTLDKSDWKDPS